MSCICNCKSILSLPFLSVHVCDLSHVFVPFCCDSCWCVLYVICECTELTRASPMLITWPVHLDLSDWPMGLQWICSVQLTCCPHGLCHSIHPPTWSRSSSLMNNELKLKQADSLLSPLVFTTDLSLLQPSTSIMGSCLLNGSSR